MDDASVVRRLERVRELPRDVQRFVRRQRPGPQAIGECRSLDELQDQKPQAVACSTLWIAAMFG